MLVMLAASCYLTGDRGWAFRLPGEGESGPVRVYAQWNRQYLCLAAKAPDAMLKVGYCYYELADWAKARETLNQVLTRFPNTPVARSAEQRLAKMKKEGR